MRLPTWRAGGCGEPISASRHRCPRPARPRVGRRAQVGAAALRRHRVSGRALPVRTASARCRGDETTHRCARHGRRPLRAGGLARRGQCRGGAADQRRHPAGPAPGTGRCGAGHRDRCPRATAADRTRAVPVEQRVRGSGEPGRAVVRRRSTGDDHVAGGDRATPATAHRVLRIRTLEAAADVRAGPGHLHRAADHLRPVRRHRRQPTRGRAAFAGREWRERRQLGGPSGRHRRGGRGRRAVRAGSAAAGEGSAAFPRRGGCGGGGMISDGPSQILAHAFGARYELPIPLVAFVLGGAAVVAASFALVVRREVRPRPDDATDRTAVRSVPGTAGVPGLIILGLLCWAGLAGAQEVAENILPTVFWVYIWVVVPLLCGLIGDFTSGSNPFGFLAQVGEIFRVRTGRAEPARRPQGLGWWPAVVLAGAGTLAELVFNATFTLPRAIAWTLIIYGALCVAMGAMFGAQAWRERGEVFTILFARWGRRGSFGFGAPGRSRFAGGLEVPLERTVSRMVFVLLLLVSISYDGILSTPQWARFEAHFVSLGEQHKQEVIRTIGFLVLIGVLFAVFGLFALAVAKAGRLRSWWATFAGLLPSLVPIAFGYLLAHYLQYVLVNGQLILPLLGAPAGAGTNLHLPYPFNDSYEVHSQVLPNGFYWYVDVAVIVVVHVIAVVLAHDFLGRTEGSPQLARRAEYPWIVAMIGYTALSLWLLAQPLTKGKGGG